MDLPLADFWLVSLNYGRGITLLASNLALGLEVSQAALVMGLYVVEPCMASFFMTLLRSHMTSLPGKGIWSITTKWTVLFTWRNWGNDHRRGQSLTTSTLRKKEISTLIPGYYILARSPSALRADTCHDVPYFQAWTHSEMCIHISLSQSFSFPIPNILLSKFMTMETDQWPFSGIKGVRALGLAPLGKVENKMST